VRDGAMGEPSVNNEPTILCSVMLELSGGFEVGVMRGRCAFI